MIAPALIILAVTMIWTGEFDEGERWLRRAERALQTDTGPDLRLNVRMASGLLHGGRGRHRDALEEFGAAERLRSQMEGSHARDSQMTAWLLATQARAGLPDLARAALAALDEQRAGSGEIRNALAVICLAESDPAGALAAVHDVLDGTAPVQGDMTVVDAHLLAGLAYRELGLAEADRLILPFAMTGSAGLLEALPRHQTAHAALLADILDILDVLHGASPRPGTSPHPRRPRSSPRASCGCCGTCRPICSVPKPPASCRSRRTPSTSTSAASTPNSR